MVGRWLRRRFGRCQSEMSDLGPEYQCVFPAWFLWHQHIDQYMNRWN